MPAGVLASGIMQMTSNGANFVRCYREIAMTRSKIHKSPLQSPEIDRPFCTECGSKMWLSQITPDGPGKEYRIFACPVCDMSTKDEKKPIAD